MRDFLESKVNLILSSILAILFVAFVIVMVFSGGTSSSEGDYVSVYNSSKDTASKTSTSVPAEKDFSTESSIPQNTEPSIIQEDEQPTTQQATTQVATTQPTTTQPATQPTTTASSTSSSGSGSASTSSSGSNTTKTTTTTTKTTTVTTVTTVTGDSSNKSNVTNNYTTNNYNTTYTTNNNSYYYNYFYTDTDKNASNADYQKQWQAGFLVAIDEPESNYKCEKVTLSEKDKALVEKFCMSTVGNDYLGSALVAQTIKNAIRFDGFTDVESVLKYYKYNYSQNVKVEKNCQEAVAYIFDKNKDAVMHKINYFEKSTTSDKESVNSKNDDSLILEYAKIKFYNVSKVTNKK